MEDLKKNVRGLFYKKNKRSLWFNRFLIGTNFLFLVLLFAEFFNPDNVWLRQAELFFGIFFAVEIVLRSWISNQKYKGVFHFFRMLDILIVISIFVRVGLSEDVFLLHFFGALRILRFYRMMDEVFRSQDIFSRHRDIMTATANLFVFVFFMTSLVFALQHDINPRINSYLDALYFTMATLTTTGFGDITPVGSSGKWMAVIIMLFGVGLFINLATSIFRPKKTFFKCQKCGLNRHDRDATHCKHCGKVVHIESDGET